MKMPAATKTTLERLVTDTNNLDRPLPEVKKKKKKKKRRDLQMPACFKKMFQETAKTFPHTKQVGTYLVGKMINQGSFAKVMEGLHLPTGEKVAIKVIDKKKAQQDSYILKNMKREPRIQQMVKHPHIVQLYETLETENSYYMVMELCLGGDLLDKICDQKKLDEREVRRFTRQIMSAVGHLHHHGIVHRDLKVENFLLDENNNIKIVDFGLSNIMKLEGLSQELLNTQCGSPAYAAPELLAHKKYGPKVDVWSIGVSMFAMLTGTLPFTVEPFNIKQLHQKMVNGEISSVPDDISSGAVHFMHSLLEPDPAKRPAIREAMKDKWLNEGWNRKPLSSITYKNRLHPEDLNSTVLNYMANTMEPGLSEIISVLINNKPSSIMASYSLLLKKLVKSQKENKSLKKNHMPSKHDNKFPKTINPNPEGETQGLQETKAATLGAFKKVSTFSERDQNDLEPPTSANRRGSDEPRNQPYLDFPLNIDGPRGSPKARIPYVFEVPPLELEIHSTKLPKPQSHLSAASCIGKGEGWSPILPQDTRLKDLLRPKDENIPHPTWQPQEKGSANSSMNTSPQLSPLPRLRHIPLKTGLSKKTSWMKISQQVSSASPLLLVNSSRPPVVPTSQQQMFLRRNLRQYKEKPRILFKHNKSSRNMAEHKTPQKVTDLNLPVLSTPCQTCPDKKSEVLKLDFAQNK
uniref:Hormonally up-regulated neu tumor-associated kinase n=1 Tax=Vombatus ursinus TaxID=29139 RepID=A0A4X2K5Z5_VOMUR